jgi:hypothetical protein
MRKGLFGNHAQELERWLSAAGRGFHVQINARDAADLKESIVLEKLNKSSTFLKTASISGADKGALKEKSAQFWQQEKNQRGSTQASCQCSRTGEAEQTCSI